MRFWPVTLWSRASSRTSSVGWISPMGPDIYGPGATIIAKWISPEMVCSPCFKLCPAGPSGARRSFGGTEQCGMTVCPQVIESAGAYQAPVTVADVPFSGQFYLQMTDDSGNKLRSPSFTLSPVGASAAGMSSSSSKPLAGIQPQAQAPLGPAYSPLAPVSSIAPPLYPSSSSSMALAPSLPLSAPRQASAAPTFDAISAKSYLPTTAYAAALSAVAAVIIVAGGLFLNHRRKVRAQWIKNTEKPSCTSTVSSPKSYASDRSGMANYETLSCHHEYRSPPLPLFVLPTAYGIVKGQNNSPSKRDTFPEPAYASWDPPAGVLLPPCALQATMDVRDLRQLQ
ncbi:hypothetical protein B0H15DRAFT_864946 [Mycena belliarum]|uniref:Uncharacterized protein n=1 Tax=Mycena belliarum TaxID=1033014 RepID=A0AAD6XMV4_9AGAR|nr:hypothetical protein B0H15DRAFT_864946 [Mycena belliae]